MKAMQRVGNLDDLWAMQRVDKRVGLMVGDLVEKLEENWVVWLVDVLEFGRAVMMV